MDRLSAMPPLREVPGPEEVIDPSGREDDPHGVDLWVMPYIRDSTLWPVLIVLIAHVVAFVSPVLLLALRDRRPGPMVTGVVLVLLSLRGFHWEVQARRKFGAISWIIVTTWVASLVAAYFGDRFDVL